MLLSFALVFKLLATFFAIQVVRYVFTRYFSRCSLPNNLPWIDAEDGTAFARARVVLRSFWHTRELVFKGYEKVCLRPQALLLRCLPLLLTSIAVLKEGSDLCTAQHHYRS